MGIKNWLRRPVSQEWPIFWDWLEKRNNRFINLALTRVGYYDSDSQSGGVWNDINFSGLALAQGAANRPSLGVFYGSGAIQGYLFNGAQTNTVFGSDEIFHGYVQGTDIKPHIHFMPATSEVGKVVRLSMFGLTQPGQ